MRDIELVEVDPRIGQVGTGQKVPLFQKKGYFRNFAGVSILFYPIENLPSGRHIAFYCRIDILGIIYQFEL